MPDDGNTEGQIEVKGLWKVFGDDPERALEPEYADMSRAEIQDELGLVVGLRDISFSVERGQIFVIMGLSGSGKSTLVRCLIRLIESTQGEIYFGGEDVLQYSQDELIEFRRHTVAMVFQHYGLLPHRNVMDNVAYGLEIQGMDKADRYRAASEAIETVGLKGWEDYYPREMSGGMQQRVGLARALARQLARAADGRAFQRTGPADTARDAGRAHHAPDRAAQDHRVHNARPDEALKLGDRIVILRDGEVAQEGSPQEIVANPADDYVAGVRARRVQGEGDTGRFHHAPSVAGVGRILVQRGQERVYRGHSAAGGALGTADSGRGRRGRPAGRNPQGRTAGRPIRRRAGELRWLRQKRIEETRPESEDQSQSAERGPIPRRYYWLGGVGLTLLVALICVAIWGTDMEFPTRVSSEDIPTASGNVVTLERTARDVTGDAIDDAVNWLVREANWLFTGLETGVEYALVWIEDGLKWIPWPAVLVGLALLSFSVGRWRILAFTTVAFLFIGVMGLWENTVDTIALMVVAVAISIAVGLPLGVLGGAQPPGGWRHASDTGRHADHAQLRVPVAGDTLLRAWEARGHIRHADIRGSAGDTTNQPGHPAGVRRGGGGGALLRDDAVPTADEGAGAYGHARR